jgi:hypothetical protein
LASEFNDKEMILLYNPAADHRCKLPELGQAAGNGITDRTIMECDQCAQRWWAWVDYGDYTKNKWYKLRWYHWVLRSKIA